MPRKGGMRATFCQGRMQFQWVLAAYLLIVLKSKVISEVSKVMKSDVKFDLATLLQIDYLKCCHEVRIGATSATGFRIHEAKRKRAVREELVQMSVRTLPY